jgi:hypothetical protein
LRGPPGRFARSARPAAPRRFVLRVRGPRLVLRERFIRTTTTRELVRALAAPTTPGFEIVRELHVHAGRLPSDSPRTSPALRPAERPLTQTVVREIRRAERLRVQTVRERIRVEHITERGQAPAQAQPRNVDARTRGPVRVTPPADAVPTDHRAPPSAAASAPPIGLVAAAGPVLPALAPPAAPPRPPSVEEIAERVLRLIERRARAQRERLGRL